jgi:hypothetical protein
VQSGSDLKDPAPTVDEVSGIFNHIQSGALKTLLDFA